MASLYIRKIDPEIYRKLRQQADKHGVSIEEEALRIISQAVTTPKKLSDVFQKYFGSENGIDLNFPNQRPI